MVLETLQKGIRLLGIFNFLTFIFHLFSVCKLLLVISSWLSKKIMSSKKFPSTSLLCKVALFLVFWMNCCLLQRRKLLLWTLLQNLLQNLQSPNKRSLKRKCLQRRRKMFVRVRYLGMSRNIHWRTLERRMIAKEVAKNI